MPSLAQSLLTRLHPRSPYEGFDPASYPEDLGGSGGNDVLRQIFDAVQPRLIIEVGSWKGGSSCFWASLLKQRGTDGAVVCVDTWLGSIENMTGNPSPQWDLRPYLRHGYSSLYYQFLANVVRQGLSDYIVPLPTTSAIAARWLRQQQVDVSLIYIDGSHDESDVYEDLTNYWKLLPPGGIICGEGFALPWHGVIAAVTRFAREQDHPMQFSQNTWVIQKRLSIDSQIVVNTVMDQLQSKPQSSPEEEIVSEPFGGDTLVGEEFQRLVAKHGIKTVVETGTYLGVTTAWLATIVPQVVTIEYDKRWDHHHLDKLANVHRFYGDSGVLVKKALEYPGPYLFFLDAHWYRNTPTPRELANIAEMGIKPVIVIHDMQVPGTTLGFDVYPDFTYNLASVEPYFKRIYGERYEYRFNDDSARGLRRGVIYVEPT